jgi:alkylhydroperoxidase family enzyme
MSVPPRIAPLEAPFAPEIAAELDRWMPPGAGVPPLAQAMHPLGSFLRSRRFALPLREREIVIDRVCARCGCGYEWGVHVAAFGAAAALDERQVAATCAADPPRGVWSAREELLVRAVDELHDGGRISNALWAALTAHYDERQLLELLVLCGWYHLISFVANGARVAHEPWAPPLPADAAG